MRNGFYIFYYHDVSENSLIPENVKTSRQRFFSEINYLQENYTCISLDDGTNKIKNGFKFNKKYFTICFDDGYLSVLETCHPFLLEKKIHHTIFLNTELLQNKKYWLDNVILFNLVKKKGYDFLRNMLKIPLNENTLIDFLRKNSSVQLRKNLISLKKKYLEDKKLHLDTQDLKKFNTEFCSFGNHSHKHLFLSNLTKNEQKKEIIITKKILNNFGISHDFFAIPFGDESSFNNDTLEIIKNEYSYVVIKSNVALNHKIVNNSIHIERIGMNNNKPEIKKYIPRRAADGIWVHVYRFIDKISNITNRIFFRAKPQ